MYLVCWNRDCRQAYDMSNYKTTDRDVKCDYCGDTVISSIGSIQITGNPIVFKTVDSEKL